MRYDVRNGQETGQHPSPPSRGTSYYVFNGDKWRGDFQLADEGTRETTVDYVIAFDGTTWQSMFRQDGGSLTVSKKSIQQAALLPEVPLLLPLQFLNDNSPEAQQIGLHPFQLDSEAVRRRADAGRWVADDKEGHWVAEFPATDTVGKSNAKYRVTFSKPDTSYDGLVWPDTVAQIDTETDQEEIYFHIVQYQDVAIVGRVIRFPKSVVKYYHFESYSSTTKEELLSANSAADVSDSEFTLSFDEVDSVIDADTGEITDTRRVRRPTPPTVATDNAAAIGRADPVGGKSTTFWLLLGSATVCVGIGVYLVVLLRTRR